MNTDHKKPFYKKKKVIIPLSILLILTGLRLYLPTWVKGYVNKTLEDIPGFHGHVNDIDISLYRGAYVIDGLYLNKVEAQTEVPFLNFPKTDISVEWKSLFKGAIVAEIIMNNPKITYILEDQQTESKETSDTGDWTTALEDIVPLDINYFEIINGNLAFVQLQSDPNIDLQLNNLNLTASNLKNVVEKELILPSPIKATAVSFGQGNLSLEGKMNIFKKIPDMDIKFSLEKSDATALNDLTRHYTGLDFDGGTFELFSEIAIADGNLKGYIKPLLIDSELIGKEDGFLETLWEGFTGFFKFILKNQKKDTVATEVPLEGDLNNVETSVWATVGGIFKNAWIKAFESQTDESIEFKDAFADAKKEKK